MRLINIAFLFSIACVPAVAGILSGAGIGSNSLGTQNQAIAPSSPWVLVPGAQWVSGEDTSSGGVYIPNNSDTPWLTLYQPFSTSGGLLNIIAACDDSCRLFVGSTEVYAPDFETNPQINDFASAINLTVNMDAGDYIFQMDIFQRGTGPTGGIYDLEFPAVISDNTSSTPEPGTLLLGATGILLAGCLRKKHAGSLEK